MNNFNNLTIRLETEKDYRAVEELTREAFWNVYVPGASEHYFVHMMRNHPDFIPELAFVLADDSVQIGDIEEKSDRLTIEVSKVYQAAVHNGRKRAEQFAGVLGIHRFDTRKASPSAVVNAAKILGSLHQFASLQVAELVVAGLLQSAHLLI